MGLNQSETKVIITWFYESSDAKTHSTIACISSLLPLPASLPPVFTLSTKKLVSGLEKMVTTMEMGRQKQFCRRGRHITFVSSVSDFFSICISLFVCFPDYFCVIYKKVKTQIYSKIQRNKLLLPSLIHPPELCCSLKEICDKGKYFDVDNFL